MIGSSIAIAGLANAVLLLVIFLEMRRSSDALQVIANALSSMAASLAQLSYPLERATAQPACPQDSYQHGQTEVDELKGGAGIL
jgi:hypothetical protein